MFASIIRCYLKWLLTSEPNALLLSSSSLFLFFSFFFLVYIKTNILQLQHEKNGAKNGNWKFAEWMRMTWQMRIRFVGQWMTNIRRALDTFGCCSSHRAVELSTQPHPCEHIKWTRKKKFKTNIAFIRHIKKPLNQIRAMCVCVCAFEYETNGYQPSNHVIAYVLMQMVQSVQRAVR